MIGGSRFAGAIIATAGRSFQRRLAPPLSRFARHRPGASVTAARPLSSGRPQAGPGASRPGTTQAGNGIEKERHPEARSRSARRGTRNADRAESGNRRRVTGSNRRFRRRMAAEQTGSPPVLACMSDDPRLPQDRAAPLPGSPEARARGCTCPDPASHPRNPARDAARVPAIDENCPVHGRATIARGRAGEAGPIDSEGDIADRAAEPELRHER
jgi:hypothetical protein